MSAKLELNLCFGVRGPLSLAAPGSFPVTSTLLWTESLSPISGASGASPGSGGAISQPAGRVLYAGSNEGRPAAVYVVPGDGSGRRSTLIHVVLAQR